MAEQSIIQITNQTRDCVLAARGELARSFWARGRGLMGRAALPEGFALIIFPESSIHTFFMRVPIDVLFVDRSDRVIGMREAMPPSRPFAGVAPWRVIAATGTVLGDQLILNPHPDKVTR
jgi:uncharacterized membrane protein (UPF0127 family)